MRISALLSLIILIVVPGCTGQRPAKKSLFQGAASHSLDTLETMIDVQAAHSAYSSIPVESHLQDIPVMVGSVLQEWPAATSTRIYYCASAYGSSEITNFYQLAMEQEGWHLLDIHEGPEITLAFQKPHTLCIISIRPLKQKKSSGLANLIYISVNDSQTRLDS